MKKKKVTKPLPKPEPVLDDLQEFQKSHGPEWLRIVQSPAFRSGLLLLNVRKLEEISNLSNEQIERNSREILAGLRDHVQLENNLMSLHTLKESDLKFDETEEYFSPEQVAELEMMKEKMRTQNRDSRYAS